MKTRPITLRRSSGIDVIDELWILRVWQACLVLKKKWAKRVFDFIRGQFDLWGHRSFIKICVKLNSGAPYMPQIVFELCRYIRVSWLRIDAQLQVTTPYLHIYTKKLRHGILENSCLFVIVQLKLNFGKLVNNFSSY